MKYFVTRKQSRGFTLVEAMVVLLIGVGIIVAALKIGDRVFGSSDVTKSTSLISEIANNLKNAYGHANRYSVVTSDLAVTAQVIPDELRDPGTTVAHNNYGAPITVVPATLTVANDAVTLTWGEVPKSQCRALVQQVAVNARRISVAGTVVKPTDLDINEQTLADQCDSAPRVSVDIDVGRGT